MVEFTRVRCHSCGTDIEIPDYLKRPHCIRCGAEIIINCDKETSNEDNGKIHNLLKFSREAEDRGEFRIAIGFVDKAIEIEPNNDDAIESRTRLARKYSTELAQRIAAQVTICRANHSLETFHLRRYGPMISKAERDQFILDSKKLDELKNEGKTYFKMAGLCTVCGGIKKCLECEGSGKCYYCKIATKSALSSCEECKGTGICKWCKGTKLCRVCLGDGLYRDMVFPDDVI